MVKVKKYASFEELKSSEGKTMDHKVTLKKHKDFENLIKTICSIKAKNDAIRKFR